MNASFPPLSTCTPPSWPLCSRVSAPRAEVCVLQEADEEGGERLLRAVLPRPLFHILPPHLCSGRRRPHASQRLAVYCLHHLPPAQGATHTWGNLAQTGCDARRSRKHTLLSLWSAKAFWQADPFFCANLKATMSLNVLKHTDVCTA